MDFCTRGDESAAFFKVFFNVLVSVFNVLSCVFSDKISEPSVKVNRHGGFARLDQSPGQANLVIVLTKSRSAVHNTSTSIRCDEIASDHSETTAFLVLLEIVVEGGVAFTLEVFALILLKNHMLFNVGLL
jgi:hypothetical protein